MSSAQGELTAEEQREVNEYLNLLLVEDPGFGHELVELRVLCPALNKDELLDKWMWMNTMGKDEKEAVYRKMHIVSERHPIVATGLGIPDLTGLVPDEAFEPGPGRASNR